MARQTLLRFATAGSVDDGKSTLVGRLLHDAKAVLADTLEAVSRTSAERGFGGSQGGIDLALLTDGLRAEREQGITIDVAYRYFATPRRSFILADCPGHVQYTRNTVTGASTADAVVLLIDARQGVQVQTRRHLAVLAVLKVPRIIIAVNKMDLIGYAEEGFAAVTEQVQALAMKLGLEAPAVIPVSALEGDNVVSRSALTPWYSGPALLELLEALPGANDHETGQRSGDFRFPVQAVLRPQGALAPGLSEEEFRDYRGYAGQVISGSIQLGAAVTVLPSGIRSAVTGIDGPGGLPLAQATAPQSVVLRLAEDLDVARGDLLAAGTLPEPRQDLQATIAWLSEKPLRAGTRVLVKHGTRTVQAIVKQIDSRLDLGSFEPQDADGLEFNDIGTVQLRLGAALPYESYAEHRRNGAFLIVDPVAGTTLAAGMAG